MSTGSLGAQWPVTEISVADVVKGTVGHDAAQWPPRQAGSRLADVARSHEEGTKRPVIVMEDHDGSRRVLDGHHRLTDAHSRGMKTYPAVVVKSHVGVGDLQERIGEVYGTKYQGAK